MSETVRGYASLKDSDGQVVRTAGPNGDEVGYSFTIPDSPTLRVDEIEEREVIILSLSEIEEMREAIVLAMRKDSI